MVEFGASLEERMARFKTKDPDHNEAKARFIKHNQQERRSHERVVDDYEKRRAAEQKQRMGGLFDSLNSLKNRGAGGERPQLVGSMTDRLAGLRDQLRTDQQTEAPSRFSTNNNGMHSHFLLRALFLNQICLQPPRLAPAGGVSLNPLCQRGNLQ